MTAQEAANKTMQAIQKWQAEVDSKIQRAVDIITNTHVHTECLEKRWEASFEYVPPVSAITKTQIGHSPCLCFEGVQVLKWDGGEQIEPYDEGLELKRRLVELGFVVELQPRLKVSWLHLKPAEERPQT